MVFGADTVHDVKTMVGNAWFIHPDRLRLLIVLGEDEKELQDKRTLQDYRIRRGHTIKLSEWPEEISWLEEVTARRKARRESTEQERSNDKLLGSIVVLSTTPSNSSHLDLDTALSYLVPGSPVPKPSMLVPSTTSVITSDQTDATSRDKFAYEDEDSWRVVSMSISPNISHLKASRPCIEIKDIHQDGQEAIQVAPEPLDHIETLSHDPAHFPTCIHKNAIPGFLIRNVIGEGASGEVRIAIDLASRQRVAVKIFDKKALSRHPAYEMQLKNEIEAMTILRGHQGVILYRQSYETDNFFYLIMEYLPGGTLFEYLKKKRTTKPDPHSWLAECNRLFLQLVEALKHCHSLGIVHRDIKPGNLMIDSKGDLKLIDFGLCAFVEPGQKLVDFVGTPPYWPPELVMGWEHGWAYEGQSMDVWSLGVTFFVMLTSKMPFYDSKGEKDMAWKIVNGAYKLPKCFHLSKISHLLKGMLTVDPAERFTLDQVLQHSWMAQMQKAVRQAARKSKALTARQDQAQDVKIFLEHYSMGWMLTGTWYF